MGLLGDFLQSAMTIQVEGGDGVWRVTVGGEGKSFQVYVVLDHGVAKVIGIGGSEVTSSLGRFVLRTADAKGEARAKKLLDWSRSDLDKSTAPRAVAFRKVWGSGLPASREAILLAAAVLAGASELDRVIPIGVRCASTLPDAELVCHELLFFAYLADQRWPEAVAQIEALDLLRHDLAATYARSHALALARCGRFDEADRVLDDVLAKDANNADARVARVQVAVIRGDLPEALRRADAIAQDPNVSPGELNEISWFRLGEGSDLTTALDLARKAVQGTKQASSAVNTLAAVEAELGDVAHAATDNGRAMELHGSIAPREADWYVAGRIDEQLGLVDDAAAAYQRIPKASGVWPTTYDLAQKRLAAIRHAR